MSGVDLKEFVSAYLGEAEEQLGIASAKLLEIDGAARRGEANPRAVRDLFRAVHTIKGLSAMVDVDAVVTISHRMESILRSADRRGGHLTVAAVDVLLQAVRAIEHRVRELADEKLPSPAPSGLLEALDAHDLRGEGGQSPAARTLALEPGLIAKLQPFEVDILSRGVKEGRRALRVDFRPSPAQAERGFSINTVRERLTAIAEIVKTVPVAVPQTESAPGGLSFALLLLTTVSDEEVASAAGVEASEVSMLAAPAPVSESPDLAAVDDEEDDGDVVIPQRRNIVRVSVSRLDDAMEHVSALVVTRSRLARAVAELAHAGVNTRALGEIMRDNTRQLRDLRAAILRVRLVPAAELLERIPLILRGVRREGGRPVRLVLDAGTAELDKGVAERIFPALVHLVRNAVDHAIEPSEERKQLGKPEEGTLTLRCLARSNTELELSVSDDGRGIDRSAVAARAGRELVPGDAALLDALCQPGLSTRDRPTTTSGRGMGMDIVRRVVVDQLGGELSMTTTPHVGTTFTLRVPLTLFILDTFTLECSSERFVVPVSNVDEIFEVDHDRVRRAPSSQVGRRAPSVIERRGEVMPLFELAETLGMPSRDARSRQAVLVRRAGEAFAFGLDRVAGQQESVVRPLVDPLVQ
ncbi:MAG TPA: ATP-binding protein, partial [Polyangiaceae bacterium]|nr:ATP-binding protein [Polyangiaceae bacterium]